ncbi:hypothetical protein BH10PLA2_BH10PLA2_01720 [soil metagenome]
MLLRALLLPAAHLVFGSSRYIHSLAHYLKLVPSVSRRPALPAQKLEAKSSLHPIGYHRPVVLVRFSGHMRAAPAHEEVEICASISLFHVLDI